MSIQECLSFDPFAGDFDGAGESDRILSDKIVKGRKEHTCTHCAGSIALREIHRIRKEVYDDELMTFRWCNACCLTMLPDAEPNAFDLRRPPLAAGRGTQPQQRKRDTCKSK